MILRILVLAVVASAAGASVQPAALEGRAPRPEVSSRPTVRASFPRESYRPGDIARLVFRTRARDVRFQLVRAGTGPTAVAGVRGTRVGQALRIGSVRVGRVLRVYVGDWASGLYFARLTARGRRIGFAPFVLRPGRLGKHRIAIVLPTQTWQAYNFADDDGDGDADTWYANERTVKVGRPYEDRGVPPRYRSYDQPFLRWVDERGAAVDYLAQSDLNRVRGRELAAAYDLLVFPGHHEYVTRREYDAVTTFRDLGGNLIFLSANNFFWKVERRGDVMRRVALWRHLGRPEAALVGVQYFAGDRGSYRRPWVVRNVSAANGLFAAAGLAVGDAVGRGGIEVDATTRDSPPGTKILAEIAWRRGRRAQMSYYETAAGAKVFAAGAFSLASLVTQPDVARLVAELWDWMARP